jgi:hypothetical protein
MIELRNTLTTTSILIYIPKTRDYLLVIVIMSCKDKLQKLQLLEDLFLISEEDETHDEQSGVRRQAHEMRHSFRFGLPY